MSAPVSLTIDNGIARICIDHPPVNALAKAVREGLLTALQSVKTDARVKAVILHGAESRFIAGADVKEMNAPLDRPFLPELVAALEDIAVPILCAIDGAALGGGLELALATDRRIAAPKVSIGLPETKLGIIPGAGGTQRLSRLVGIPKAIALVGDGTVLSARDALALGIVDEISDTPLETALHQAEQTPKRRLSALTPPSFDPADADAASKATRKKAKGLPAVSEAVRVIMEGATMAFAAAVANERSAFTALRDSAEAKALRYQFFAEKDAWKAPGLEGVAPRILARAAVIGAGTMGSGIAAALANAGIPVLLLERDAAAAEAGADRIAKIYEQQVASGRLDAAEGARRRALVETGTDWSQLGAVDFIIEAAFEDLAVKKSIFKTLGEIARPGAILASNTSYLDLDSIADASGRAADVVGLHFFSPAHIMKLLEIVRAKATAPDVLATALKLAKLLKKQPVISGNREGFIGNRVYAAYRRHAEYLVEDGADPQAIDQALENYGFAMGIFAVSDMSGLDIAYAMRKRQAATRDPNMRYVAIADALCEAGHLGRKTGSGWYSYADGKRTPSEFALDVIGKARAGRNLRSFTAEEIVNRLLAAMANEAAALLSEGVAVRASDVDVAFVNGYGFPRMKGGPVFAADARGLDTVLADIRQGHAAGGAGSEVSPLVERTLAQGLPLHRFAAR